MVEHALAAEFGVARLERIAEADLLQRQVRLK